MEAPFDGTVSVGWVRGRRGDQRGVRGVTALSTDVATVGGFRVSCRLLRKLARQLRPYWRHVAGLFRAQYQAVPLKLLARSAQDSGRQRDRVGAFAGVSGHVASATVSGSKLVILAFAAALLVGVAVMVQALELCVTWFRTYVGEKILLGFRTQLFRSVPPVIVVVPRYRGTSDATYRIQ